jgi:hypothetical protein
MNEDAELLRLAEMAELQIRKLTATGWPTTPDVLVTAIILNVLEKAYAEGFNNAPTQ